MRRLALLWSTKKKRRKILRPAGQYFNLKEIFDRINERYFESKVDLHITWHGNREFRPRRRVMLGSYNSRTKLIKIHRLLDQAHIPEFFVSSIVYHEILHHVVPPFKKGGRRAIHHPAFRAREKQFHDYALAKDYHSLLKKELFSNR